MSNDSIKVLNNTVIENQICIGCGVCAVEENSPFEIWRNEYGLNTVKIKEKNSASVQDFLAICPFSGKSDNENTLSDQLNFGSNSNNFIGSYSALYAGHVLEGEFHEKGSSGGIGKWISFELLKQKEVDFIVQVIASNEEASLYSYSIVTDYQEVINGSKSVYYPVELSEVIKKINSLKGTFCITAIPCFAKALRLYANTNKDFKSRMKYVIGLVCGHLKSSNYAEMIAWQAGILPGNLKKIDFRKRIANSEAREKGVELESNNTVISSKVKEFFGTDYNLGFFKYNACNYCDDVFAETADIVIGDAWIPEYYSLPKGTNILVIRNTHLADLIEGAFRLNKIFIERLSEDKIISSQEGGLRDRREGLAYRLFLDKQKGKWYPEKRVLPVNIVSLDRRKIYEMRIKMAQMSHKWFFEAKLRNDLNYFVSKMKSLSDKYYGYYYGRPDINTRILNRIKSLIRKLW